MRGYSHIGEVHKALALSKELKARGLKCDEIMPPGPSWAVFTALRRYNSLIDGCAKARKLPEGLAVFEEMLQAKVQPSNITFSILVKLHFEAIENKLEVLAQWQSGGSDRRSLPTGAAPRAVRFLI